MTGNDEFEYRYKLEFPLAKAYAVDDILNFISAVVYHSTYLSSPETSPLPTVSGNWGGDAEQERQKKEFLANHKTYLIDRLLKAVVAGKFELWDWSVGKVVDPPINSTGASNATLGEARKPISVDAVLRILNETSSSPQNGQPESDHACSLVSPTMAPFSFRTYHRPIYQTAFWWATMSSILKPDLVKFCNAEGMQVIFEGEQAIDHVANAGQEKGVNPDSRTAQPINNATLTTNGKINQIPELPRAGITKLAIEAAWEIECEVGRHAFPHEVIKRLQDWVEKEGNCLDSKTESGVTWVPLRKMKAKPFDVEACEKALKAWHIRRQSANRN